MRWPESLFHILSDAVLKPSRTNASVECQLEHGEPQVQKSPVVATLYQKLPLEVPLKVPHPNACQGRKRNVAPAIPGCFPERVGATLRLIGDSRSQISDLCLGTRARIKR